MANILEVATREFSDKGLAGARIDEIAAATRTSKRMIYYYFESKEGLYVAVLEEAYRRMRAIEAELHLEDLYADVAEAEAIVVAVAAELLGEGRRRLGWRFWWGNPFAGTTLLSASKAQA